MATPENGTNMSSDIDIDALINADVDENDVSAVVNSLHQELNSTELHLSQDVVNSEQTTSENESQNGPPNSTNDITDLTKAIKTEGEASFSTRTTSSPQLTLNLSTPPNPSSGPDRRQSFPSMSPFGGLTPQTPLTPNAQLITSEEHAAIYKQASLYAIHTLFSKNGQTRAKEILDRVTKVKNFLTNLVHLAAKSGPQVRLAVHSLVQKLVGGGITEDEFAKKIEDDLKSKHQPGLLPFLQTSVPDLRLHLQLQKEYMKQLIDKKVAEKVSQRQPGEEGQQTTPTQSPKQVPVSSAGTPLSSSDQTPTTSIQTIGGIGQQTPLNLTQSPATVSPITTALTFPGLSSQQQQLLKMHIANLPEDQQKIYLEQVKMIEKQRKLQVQQAQLALQQKQLKNNSTKTVNNSSALTSQQQQLSVLLKQTQLIRQQQQQASLALGGQGTLNIPNQTGVGSPKKIGIGQGNVSPRKSLTSLLTKKITNESHSPTPSGKAKLPDEEDDDDTMDIAGVNLKEETAHFLPPSVTEAVNRSCKDKTLLDSVSLRERMLVSARLHGITDISEDAVSLLSHATEERLRNIIDKVTIISHHRSENLKDDSHYETSSDIRGQLKVLERIDHFSANRRQEKEKERIMRAAKSRSKQDDPELAKMKEQAKQLQLAQEKEIHQRAANTTALAAIGRRKRTANTAFGDSLNTSSTSDPEVTILSSSSKSSSSAAVAAVFSNPGPSKTKQKRRLQGKDVIFMMEQERETQKSRLLYKSFLS